MTKLLPAALLSAACIAPPSGGETPPIGEPWLNAELVAWDKDVIGHHRLAQALGYAHVADHRPEDFPGHSSASEEHSAGLGFYLNDPHKNVQPPMGLELSDAELREAVAAYPHSFGHFPELSRAIDEEELAAMREDHPAWFAAVKEAFEATKAWANKNQPFPANLAVLQEWGDGRHWEPCSDFQQRAVIDAHADAIVAYAKRTEGVVPGYRFTGVVIDVVELWEEFSWSSDRPLPGEPAHERHAVLHPGITHEYQTIQEGWYHFLGTLRDRLQAAFPDREVRFVWEPTPMVPAWIQPMRDAAERYDSVTPELIAKIKGDAILDEKPGLRYLTDPTVVEPAEGDDDPLTWPITRLGTASGDLFTKNPHLSTQVAYLGEVSSRDGSFLSYGTFDRSRDPVEAYGNQFKLIRALSSWQNGHGTAIEDRVYDADAGVYLSPSAYADEHAVAGVHPDGKRIFAVLADADAAVPLAAGVTLSNLRSANAWFESGGGTPAAGVRGGALVPTSGADFPLTVIADAAGLGAGPPLAFAAPAGVELTQDKSTTQLPNATLLNPGFEKPAIDAWSGTGSASVRRITDAAEGAGAVEVTARTQPWNNLRTHVTGVLMNTRQGRYRVSAVVKASEPSERRGKAVFFFQFSFNERGERRVVASDPRPVEVGVWTPIEAEPELEWGDWIEQAQLIVGQRASTSNYKVDAVELEFLGR